MNYKSTKNTEQGWYTMKNSEIAICCGTENSHHSWLPKSLNNVGVWSDDLFFLSSVANIPRYDRAVLFWFELFNITT